MANLFADNFDRGDSDSLGANWTERLGDWDIVSNTMKFITSGGDSSAARTSAGYATADYEVSVIITPAVQSQHRGPCGRAANYSTSDTDCYTALLTSNGTDLDLYKRVSGSWTKIADGTFSYSAGVPATVKVYMNGTDIRGYADGVQKCNATDSAISAAGDAGCIAGANVNDLFDDFSVDDFTAGGVSIPVVMANYRHRRT